MTVLNNIKKLREGKNISQRELARLSGVDKSTIIRLENGESIPSQITILKISKGLNEECSVVFHLNWRKHVV